MPNYSAIECNEITDSRTENWSSTGSNATVMLSVAWELRYDLLKDLLSSPAKPYPYNGHIPTDLFVNSVQINNLAGEGYTLDGQAAKYTEAHLTVTYTADGQAGGRTGSSSRRTDPNLKEEVYVEETIEPNREFHTLEGKMFSWKEDELDPVSDASAPVVQDPGIRLRRSVRGLSSLHSSILNIGGKVNDTAYTSILLGGLQFGIGELLAFDPIIARSTAIVSLESSGASVPVGQRRTFDVTLSWGYKEGGWNLYPDLTKPITTGLTETDEEGAIAVGLLTLSRKMYTVGLTDAAGKLLPKQPRFLSYPFTDMSRWLW